MCILTCANFIKHITILAITSELSITIGDLVTTGFQIEAFFFISSNGILNKALIHNVKTGANIERISISCQLIL